ncbi:MAG: phage major capsid protein [Candidatus Fimivicinus sp.]|nr:phage major capsid protein [Oscillospiraceae bacterium]MDY5590652.1 phage major capsid protein [Candidatus Fimivicinus sp.]
MNNYDTIRLEKGMYAGGRSLTRTLEALDPSENYKGSALEGLDAFQRQLKRFDIRVSGPGSDVVEKFFQTSDSAALFPEYVSRAVRQGLDEADVLPRIVAATTKIDGMDYRTITSVPEEDDRSLKRVAEGAFIPQTAVKTQENLVRLHKRGRMLVASYEAIRFQRLDLFTVTLRQIGSYIARAQLRDAVDVLVNGDGNDNAAPVVSVSQGGTLSYDDLIKLWNSFDPYALNTLVASPGVMEKLLSLTEFRDAAAGLNFHATGSMVTPLGADLVKSAAVGEGKLIALDRSCALEKVQAQDVMTDYDKLIDRQLERASITTITGFAKIFTDASKVLSI